MKWLKYIYERYLSGKSWVFTKYPISPKIRRIIGGKIFGEGFRPFWSPSEYSTTISRPVEYSIDAFLGDPQIKNRKKRFSTWFFQIWSKISLNIEFCLKNTLNTPRGKFLPIFHHICQYKPLENIFFYENHDFLRFLNFDDAIDYSAGTGRKWVLWTSKILLHNLYVIIWWLEQIF